MKNIHKIPVDTDDVWYESSGGAADIVHEFLIHHQHTLVIAHKLPHSMQTFLTEQGYNHQAEHEQQDIGLTFYRIWDKNLTLPLIQKRVQKEKRQTVTILFFSRDEWSILAYKIYATIVLQRYSRRGIRAHITICDINKKSAH